MLKKFYKRYGFSIITTIILTAIFFFGFVVGKYGKAAPSISVIEQEQYGQEQTPVVEDAEPVEVLTEEKYTELKVIATAYCPCLKCCGKTDGITATGTQATAGRTIAVDPSVIPYGTEVFINGHTYIAEDTGGAIKGNRIDMFFISHEDAQEFGVQELTALIKTERND